MKGKLAITALVAFLIGAGGAALVLTTGLLDRSGQPPSETQKQLWTCGMHPQVLQDEPGDCPICHMKLTPVDAGAEPDTAARHEEHGHEAAQPQLWTCPMHPQVLDKEPGQCPICNMDLVPVESEGGNPAPPAPAAAGPAVRVSKAFLQNFAVRTVMAERGAIPLELHSVGKLSFNERDIVIVNTKFEGWVENARVNYAGEAVGKGDLLFEIYSPQLVTTQKEYLAARLYVDELTAAGAQPDAIGRARALAEAAQERLRWWDISEAQIQELETSGAVQRTLRVYSPAAGIVIEKMGNAIEGMKVTPGMTVFKIAALSTVWADVQLYEHQIPHVRPGQTARITVDAYPGRRWTGKVRQLDPALNPQTRTLTASVEIPNSGGLLRPEMYVNVEFQRASPADVVRVPEEVVLRTGERSLVVVRKGDGLFEPREVELGYSGAGYQEIRSGLEAGETVVASSQFLIDSESKLRAAVNQMLAGAGDHAGH